MGFKGNCSHFCILRLLQSFQFLPSSAKQSTNSWHLCEKPDEGPFAILCFAFECPVTSETQFETFLNPTNFKTLYPCPTEGFSTSILPFSLLFYCLLPSIHDLFITDPHFWYQLMSQPRRITWLVSMQRLQLFVVCLTLSWTKTQRIYYLYSLIHDCLLLSRQVQLQLVKQVYLLYKLLPESNQGFPQQLQSILASSLCFSITQPMTYYHHFMHSNSLAQASICPLSRPASTYNPAFHSQFMRKCSEASWDM